MTVIIYFTVSHRGSISDHGQPVLFFEQAARGIPLRAGGFLLLGLFLYGGAAYALYALIRGKAR